MEVVELHPSLTEKLRLTSGLSSHMKLSDTGGLLFTHDEENKKAIIELGRLSNFFNEDDIHAFDDDDDDGSCEDQIERINKGNCDAPTRILSKDSITVHEHENEMNLWKDGTNALRQLLIESDSKLQGVTKELAEIKVLMEEKNAEIANLKIIIKRLQKG